MTITSAGQQTTDSLNGKLTFEQDKNRIIGRDENNLPRLVIIADGINFVMKVSKPGFDVLVATDDQLMFNSSQNLPKITQTDSLEILPPAVWSAGQTITVSAPHPQPGERPAYLSYIDIPVIGAGFTQEGSLTNVPAYLLTPSTDSLGSLVTISVTARVDETNIYCDIQNTSSVTYTDFDVAGPWVFRYYVLQETAS